MLRVPRRLARKYVSADLLRRARRIRGSARGLRSGRTVETSTVRDKVEAEPLIAALREGRSLAAGLVAEVRDRVAADDLAGATAMSAALSRDATTAAVGDLCFGIVSFDRGYVELAWQKFATTPVELWSRFAPSEYVRAGVDQDLEAVLRAVKGLLAAPPAHMNARRWMEILEPVFGAGEMDLAEEIFTTLDAAMSRQHHVGEKVAVRRDWIRRWINRSPSPRLLRSRRPTCPSR